MKLFKEKPPKQLRELHRSLVEEWSNALAVMMRDKAISHSFCVVNDKAAYTMLILWTKCEHDQEIYAALKPIMDRLYGEGTLVEPNVFARPGNQDALKRKNTQ